MSDKVDSNSLNLEGRVALARNEFESSWRAGRRPTVEGFLLGRAGEELDTLRRELIDTERKLIREQAAPTSSIATRTEAVWAGGRQTPGLPGDIGPADEPIPGYRLLKRLGSGGFGEVWSAEGPGRVVVALKFVHLREGCGQLELRSLETIKGIRHPNLLSPFGTWRVGDRLVIGMELADGTLMDRLSEAEAEGLRGVPGEELLEYVAEAAKGIDHLNEHRHAADDGRARGVQHRDIKPQNILLVGGGVKVADFGLARLVDGLATGHSGSLTPSYAAPEFFRGETSDQSDQYSLAITYCHLVGGRMPFVGPLAAVVEGHLHRPPDLSMVPQVERAVVARALSKSPSDRWPNCRAFVTALRSAPAASRLARSRRRVAIAAISTVAVGLAAVAWRAPLPTVGRPVVPITAVAPPPNGPMILKHGPPTATEGATVAQPSIKPSTDGALADFLAEGERAYSAGDFDSALVAYSEAIRLDDSGPAAFNNLASAYYKLGYFDAAITNFGLAIKLDARAARPYYNRGTARYSAGLYRESIQDFEAALNLDPDLVEARINLDLARRMLKAPDRP